MPQFRVLQSGVHTKLYSILSSLATSVMDVWSNYLQPGDLDSLFCIVFKGATQHKTNILHNRTILYFIWHIILTQMAWSSLLYYLQGQLQNLFLYKGILCCHFTYSHRIILILLIYKDGANWCGTKLQKYL